MSGTPDILVDDILSVVQYSSLTLTPSHQFDGIGTGQAFRVADGRRATAWTSTTPNTEHTLTWAHSLPRPFNRISLDRGSSVLRLIGEVSDDNFTTTQTLFDITLPTTPGAGSLDDALGVRALDTSWHYRLPQVAAGYSGRIRIPAMGAGLIPTVTGLKIGLSYRPGYRLWPLEDESDELHGTETVLASGARGRGRQRRGRSGALTLRFAPEEFDFEAARYPLDQIRAGRPFWLIEDDGQAQFAVFALREKTRMSFPEADQQRRDRGGVIPWVEVEPA